MPSCLTCLLKQNGSYLEIPCRVTISDSMSSYLKVAVHISSQISPEETSVVCPDILCTVRRGLEVVADKMHYSDEDMESHVAFFCPGHKQGVETPHPAKVASSQKRLFCCYDGMIFSRLGDEHDVWFAEQTGEFSKLISSTIVIALIIMLMDLYFSFIGSVKKKRKMAVLPSAKGMQALGKRYTTQVTRFCFEWDPYM